MVLSFHERRLALENRPKGIKAGVFIHYAGQKVILKNRSNHNQY